MEGDWKLERDDEGFADGESPDDDTMETALAAEGEDEVLNGPRATVYYAVPVSPTEKEEQGKDFTKEEVAEMMKSEPYQKKISTCHLCKLCWYENQYTKGCQECGGYRGLHSVFVLSRCKLCWYENQYTKGCQECGGYALQRPCCVCAGQCDQIWRRNIAKSHSFHKAHWDGRCDLPMDLQSALMQQADSDSSERTISAGLQGLSTR